ncbi:hypothetical protein FDECE_12758 [Fusarium decemcellulare]|nr:hypothetical protein FDECE_12758 [Fusarium decemcellulare]
MRVPSVSAVSGESMLLGAMPGPVRHGETGLCRMQSVVEDYGPAIRVLGSLCHDPSHRPRPPTTRDTEPARDNRLSLPFLLRASDPQKDSMVHVMATEPERDSETLRVWRHQNLPATDWLSETIDPSFLLLDFSGMLSDTTESYQGVQEDSNPLSIRLEPFEIPTDTFSAQINTLTSQLQALAVRKPHLKEAFERSCQRGFFTSTHFQNILTAYFRLRHYHVTFIHWPTFDPEKISLHLLLAVIMMGATGLQHRDYDQDPIVTAPLLELAEVYIFAELKKWVKRAADLASSPEGIEICQAAVLFVALQNNTNSVETRQRIGTKRNPMLIALLRTSGLVGFKHRIPPHETTWSQFLHQEICIKVVSWAFMNDNILAMFCNHPPVMTVKEMSGHLPCPMWLWEAEPEEFEARKHELQVDSYPSCFSEAVSGLLGDQWTNSIAASFAKLDVLHLHLLIFALQPAIFHYRTSMLPPSSSDILLRAIDRWSLLWAAAYERIPVDERKWIGLARYAPELAVLSRRIIQVTGTEGGKESRYLQGTASYNTADLHQFIRQYGLEDKF